MEVFFVRFYIGDDVVWVKWLKTKECAELLLASLLLERGGDRIHNSTCLNSIELVFLELETNTRYFEPFEIVRTARNMSIYLNYYLNLYRLMFSYRYLKIKFQL